MVQYNACFKSEIAQQIRQRRALLGISQEDLAEITNVSVRTLKAIENGDGNPTLDVLSKVLESLGLKLTVVERVTHG